MTRGLNEIPLNLPGQSGQEKWNDMAVMTAMYVVMPFSVFLSMLLGAFLQMWSPGWSSLVWLSAGLLGTVAWAFLFAKQRMKKLRAMSLGFNGEIITAQYLASINDPCFFLYHDLDMDGYNIDHLIICRFGVFAIETKARTKVDGHEVVLTEKGVSVGGGIPRMDHIDQARRNSKALYDLMISISGRKKLRVQAVVLYPEWYVHSDAEIEKKLWCEVNNPKYFSMTWNKRKDYPSLKEAEVESLRGLFEQWLQNNKKLKRA